MAVTVPTFTITDDTQGVSSGTNTDRITSDTSLTFGGTGTAGNTIRVFVNGVEIGSTTVGGGGTWTFIPGSPFAEGSYSVQIHADDGSLSAIAGPFTMVVDTTAPTVPTVTGLHASSDTGTLGDNLTNDNDPIVTGTAEPGSVVTVFVDGISRGTALTNGSGVWQFDITGTTADPLADGPHQIAATSEDAAGNLSLASPQTQIDIDTTPPAVPAINSITVDSGPSTTDEITNDNQIVLNGTGTAGSVVTIEIGGTAVGTALVGGGGTWTFATAVLADGTHNFTAFATDTAGNASVDSAVFPVVIDTAAPAAPVIADITADTGQSASDNITADNNLSVFGNAGSAEPNTLVRLFNGINLLGTTTSAGDGSWAIPTGVLADGDYELRVDQVDAAGNASLASILNVTIDTAIPAEPVVTSVTDDTGSTVGNPADVVTTDLTPTLNGTAEPFAIIQVYRDDDGVGVGLNLGTVQADASGNWSFTDTSGALTDGNDYFYDIDQTDVAGNTNLTIVYQSKVTIDLTAPTAPVDGDVAANSIPEDVANGAVTGVDANATDATSTIIYSLSNSAGGRFTIDPTSGVVTVANASLINFEAASSHEITVVATDQAGNATSSNFTINITNVAPPAPVDADGAAGGSVGDDSPAGTAVGITASSPDVHGGNVTYSLVDNAGGRFQINPTTGVVTVLNPALLDSNVNTTHNITVRATDAGGLNSVADTVFAIAVTNSQPSIPVDTNAAADAVTEGAANGTTVGITANSTDQDGVTYSLFDDAGGRFAINATTGVVTVANSALINFESAASHNITVRATDGNGATRDQVFTIAVNNVVPTTPVDTNAGTNTVAEGAANGTAVGVTANSTDVNGGTITYSLTDNAGGRFAINATTGVVTVANAALINFEAATSHNITVQASDGTGNATQTFSIAVTNVAPSTPVDTNAAANAVAENAANGTVVGVTANSTDVNGGTITYSLTDNAGGRFAINPTTGVVTVANGALLDFETATSHNITVQSSDGTATATQSFTIAVNDVLEFNLVTGTPGNDKNLVGTNGDDRIDGLAGKDKMSGLNGNDVYVVDNKGDKVIEQPGGGTDTVESSITFKLGNNVENIILTGNAAINATGNNLNNVITGNSGNNILDGGKGGNDIFVFAGTFGNDQIKNFIGNGAAAGDTIQFDSAIFADFAAVIAATTDTGKNLVINAGAFGSITLLKVADVSLLNANDFTFV